MREGLGLACAALVACGGGGDSDDDGDDGDDTPAVDGPIGGGPDGADGAAARSIVVAVGYGQRLAYSLDGGTWEMDEVTPNGGDDNDLYRGVGWGGGDFVAVGGSSAALTAASADGITWQPGGTARAWIGDVAWNGSAFVGAGGNGLRVRSIDTGATWIDDAGYQATHYRAVAAGGGVVVAVGHSYDGGGPGGANVGVIATTADGVGWTERRRAGAVFGSVAYGAGVFVASGAGGLVSASPVDGVTWFDQVVGTGGGAVIFTGAEFVLSKDDAIYTSPDGARWTPASGDAREVRGSLGNWYFATSWPLAISRSFDLVTWEPVFTPMGSGLTDMVTGTTP